MSNIVRTIAIAIAIGRRPSIPNKSHVKHTENEMGAE